MQAIQDLIQGNMTVVILVVVAAIPFCYVYRQYTYPFFFHVFEAIIYASIVHALLSGLVRLAAWFKENSSFDKETVTWTTPLFEPWNREGYDPGGLFWVTVVAWIAIAYIIIVIRPVGTKNRYRRDPEPIKKGATAGATPKGSTYTYKGGRTSQQQQSSGRKR